MTVMMAIPNPEDVLHLEEMQQIEAAKKKAAFKKGIASMTMFDNMMMRCVFKGNVELVREILRIILGIDFAVDGVFDREAVVDTEKKMQTTPDSKTIYLDVYARDKDGNRYNFEIQNDSGRMPPERMRYNSSMLDVGTLKAGMGFRDLPSTYVLVFCKKDYYKKGEPFYILNRRIMGKDERNDYGPLKDRSNIILINGEYRGKDAIGNLMEDFSQTDWRKIVNLYIKDAMMFYKEYESGRDKMLEMFEMFNKSSMDIYNDGEKSGLKKGLEQGLEQGDRNRQIKTILNGFEKGYSIAVIADMTECSVEEINRIIKENTK